MSSLSKDLLPLAESLLASGRPGAAARRRAVSTAYYALFHRLSALCAKHLIGAPKERAIHWRAYRALEHRQVREALARSDEFRATLGDAFAKLQDVRQWADYSVAPHYNERSAELRKAFTLGEANDCVTLAREAIEAIDRLAMTSRRLLTTQLLVRDRR